MDDPKARHALEMRRVDRQWNWRRPIDFWGIVLDEQDRPIEGAEVTFTWTDLSTEGTSRVVKATDKNGFVELTGKEGYVLVIQPRKKGYYGTKLSNVSLNYAEPWDLSYHEPDRNRPVIMYLRMKGTPEPLIHRRMLRYPFGDDGQLALDLFGQREVAGDSSEHDLRFSVQRGEDVLINGNKRFDWEVEVEVPGGGLVEYSEEFPFLAPEAGYLPRFVFRMKADDPNWRPAWEMRCYIRIRDGKHFGRVHFKVNPFTGERPASVRLDEYFVNPSGSRNLEFDETLDISEQYYIPRSRGRN